MATVDLDTLLSGVDDDGDLEFFQGLFDELPAIETDGEDLFRADELSANESGSVDALKTEVVPAASTLPSLIVRIPASSDRRRQRWLTQDIGSSVLPMQYGWKEVAKTQKQAREAAEEENAQLRKLVKAHERAVQKMMQLTDKAHTTLLTREILAQPITALGMPYLGPPADIPAITRSLDALAREAEEAIRANLASSSSASELQLCGFQNRIVSMPTGDALESTAELSFVLPFDVDAITGAMVEHSINLVVRKHVPNCTTVYESPDFKVVQAVTKAKEKNGVRIAKQGQIATRREPPREDGSQVVVLESTGGFYMGESRVVVVEGDSCIHVSPVPGHDSAALGPLSRIKWLRRFRAQPTAAADITPADRARWIAMFTANSARKTDRQVDKISQALENCHGRDSREATLILAVTATLMSSDHNPERTCHMNGVDGPTMSVGDLSARPALLGELDGDLEFFHELFDDFPISDGSCETDASDGVCETETTNLTAPSPPPLATSSGSDRRRKRWLTFHASSWKEVAKSQKSARKAAEDENARLRRLVVGHERAVQKMVKLMQKSAALSSREIVVAMGMGYSGPPADVAQITRSLDALALSADAMLSSTTTASPDLQICGLENRVVQSPKGDMLESTVEMAWLLPFDVDAITSALVAHSMRLVTRKHVPNSKTVYESPDFKIIQAVTEAKEKMGVLITKHGQLSSRREPPRSDGSQLVVMDMKGAFRIDDACVVSIEGDSWILVSPMPNHDSAALGPLSCIKWCRRFRLLPAASADMTPAQRAQWINTFTLNSSTKTERRIDKLTQGIENLLLSSN